MNYTFLKLILLCFKMRLKYQIEIYKVAFLLNFTIKIIGTPFAFNNENKIK